jgi:hypothetical protein
MQVQDIETAIAQLSPEELAELVDWFDRFHAEVWDRQIEADARAGRLDGLIRQADEDFEAGRCKPL